MKKYKNDVCYYDDAVVISCKKLENGWLFFKDETLTNIYRRIAK